MAHFMSGIGFRGLAKARQTFPFFFMGGTVLALIFSVTFF